MNKKRKWIAITVAIVILTNALTFIVANKVSLYLPNGKVEVTRTMYNDMMDFKKLFTAKDLIDNYYIGKEDKTAMEEAALKGMTSALNDPYTVYMNKTEWQSFNSETQGNYAGIGVQIDTSGTYIKVDKVTKNSPAEKAGIVSGDLIKKVNGTEVTSKDSNTAVSLMRGEPGTDVTVTFSREGKGDFDKKITRQTLSLVNVHDKMLTGTNIGYIQIDMFNVNTGKDFQDALKRLKSQGMKGLILDLRGNPGGLLEESRKVASNFIPKGKTIVYTVDKAQNKEISKSDGGDFIGLPLVLLVDENTASASEIVSGAIKDYKAGTLVGTKTFGKGIVQNVFSKATEGWFSDNTALKVTIAKYYSPNGVNIQGTGITPDIAVTYPDDLKKQTYDEAKDPQLNKAIEQMKEKIK